ncbi:MULTISPECIES: hypothetical protein [Streptomyces]|uniref:Uncharacterized protein n=1 Tax=Streptomyces griseus subsp. griseus (strain JCM 4626 / CBS 651.72 / NBRC 13350 / KCC S-0626 / ISP 5235) TaxID=455632 RepID=B1W2X2_STRGG|nr:MULTISPECIES: hypothetical protein [Streptomyces]MYR10856.1 hypothetical protein [Streptomyces sp. SID724]MYT80835.1 hypothetical protein [Streptomyces sp. SID8364]MBW3705121.1 hypothetical protein [Streptomyces griseus]NEB52454.1 hypothetical protein [Streptomyces griseus]SBV01228.1 hypothetical protein YW3DRAFT_01743 [Streptomyces sp. MnatMP-M77]
MSGPDDSPSVLYASERTFRVWRYGVGHSHLLLRSLPDGEDTTQLDLRFEMVRAMRLVTRYEALRVVSVDAGEFSRVFAESGVPPVRRHTQLVVGLRSRTGTGYVQCGRVVLDRREGRTCDGEDPPGPRDVVWSLRPGGPVPPSSP